VWLIGINLNVLSHLDELALKRLLREPKNALVKQYQRLFERSAAKPAFDRTRRGERLRAVGSLEHV
jgi:ATP-dependent protease Clp ATPase subunit